MLIPTSADATLHRWPIVSAALSILTLIIAALVLLQALFDLMDLAALQLPTGSLSINGFVAPVVMLENAVALWLFGMVVEGRLGWSRYLGCLALIGLISEAVHFAPGLVSIPFMPLSGISPLVTGALAMAAFWAPRSEVVFDWYWYYWMEPIEVRISYWVISILFLTGSFLEVLFVPVLDGAPWSHLAAAFAGTGLAFGLLKAGAIRRDGEDLISVLQGVDLKKEKEAKRAASEAERERRTLESDANLLEGAQQQFHAYLVKGNADAALTLHKKMSGVGGGLSPTVEELKALVGGLHKAGRFAESAPFMAELIRRAPDVADPVRLKLAQMCVVELDRPGRAIDLLDAVDEASLGEQQRGIVAKIRRRAAKMQSEGLVELDDGEW